MIIEKSELEGMKISIAGGLNTDAGDADTLSTTTGDFITVLQGKSFEGDYKELIVQNLESYKNAITKRRELSLELASKIETSLNTIINAMGDETTIDTSKKEELKIKLQDCENRISSLNIQLSAFKTNYDTEQTTANLDQLRGINRTIDTYKQLKRGIEIDIQKIERVEQADADALSNLSGLDEMISAYKTLTSEIEALKSNIPSYTPPATTA